MHDDITKKRLPFHRDLGHSLHQTVVGQSLKVNSKN